MPQRFFKRKNDTVDTQPNSGTPSKDQGTDEESSGVKMPCPDCDGTGLLDHKTAGNSASQPCPRCDASGTITE